MKEIKLTKNLYMYTFEPDEERVLGQNIFVLYHNEECIVFDAGYERHMKQLKPTLDRFKVKYVICTHFHPDHCYGLNILPKQNVVGSIHALETLDLFDNLDNELLKPDILVEDKMVIEFNNHTITLKTNPGHSNCELLIDIDGLYVLVGDEYMTTNQDKPVLPYVAETVQQHIASLEYIHNNYKKYTYLPSHGVITTDESKLEYRIRYLNFTLENKKDIEDFYNPNDEKFLCEKWHKLNKRRNSI